MQIKPFDVIRIHDKFIMPPGPKMVVCVSARYGLFLRINSRDPRGLDVPLPKNQHHPFLGHDSFIECSGFIELDDYAIGESLSASGTVGAVHDSLGEAIIMTLDKRGTVSAEDLRRVAGALRVTWPKSTR